MISASVAPFFRWSMATTWAVLLPSRGPALSCALAAFLALGAFLTAVVFLVALALADAPLAACAPPLAFLRAFGFAGSASGLAGSPSRWIRSQMRLAAVLVLLNPFTGFTPGRLFHTATRRSVGQAAASSASSFWLAKVSKGAAVTATDRKPTLGSKCFKQWSKWLFTPLPREFQVTSVKPPGASPVQNSFWQPLFWTRMVRIFLEALPMRDIPARFAAPEVWECSAR